MLHANLDSSSSDLIPKLMCLGVIVFLESLRVKLPPTSTISPARYSKIAAINTAASLEVRWEYNPYFNNLWIRPGGKIIPAFLELDILIILLTEVATSFTDVLTGFFFGETTYFFDEGALLT